jgi:hypothetical protein
MFESLESRRLLAGNVNVAVIGGHLIISGDNAANGITIEPHPEEDGTFIINGDLDTSLSGEFGTKFMSGVTGDVRISLRGGGDRVVIRGIEVAKNLVIDSGAGDDRVELRDVAISQRLTVWTDTGADRVIVTDVHSRGQTHLSTGFGYDLIATAGLVSDGDASIRTGAGIDTVSLAESTFNGDLLILSTPGQDRITTDAQRHSFDFRNGAQGWTAGYSDWDQANPQNYQFDSGIRTLPGRLGTGTGFLVSGNNASDDLLMYLTRTLDASDGIVAGARYLVRFRITFGSNAPSDCFGPGQPGESVYMKAGASATAPANTLDPDGFYRLNLDHGQQAQDGRDLSNVGTIENGIPCEEVENLDSGPYNSLTRTQVHSATVTAGADRKLHLIVGTDSGYEGKTAIYYQKIDVSLVRIAM